MAHPLAKLYNDLVTLKRSGAEPLMPMPAPPIGLNVDDLIEFAKSKHLIISVTTDVDAKRAALIKARDGLNEQIAALDGEPK